MKPIGDIDLDLRLKVEKDREHKKLKLSQELYTKIVLKQFGMTNCRPTACLVAPSANLKAHKGSIADFPYSQAVGSVMYLAMDIRSDIAFSVGMVSRYASNPEEVHVKAVKRILCYLRVTTAIGLTFGGSTTTD